MGHSIDGDGRSFSLGSTLVQEKGQTWNLTLRYMQINMMNVEGNPNRRHSLSPTPQDRADIQLTHVRSTSLGRIHIGIGYSYLDDEATGANTSDITGFVSWSTR
jgi:hypothetical protein